MADRFFTFMVLPEKSSRVKKITLPSWYLKIAAFGISIFFLLGCFVFFDYLHILSKVAESKRLRSENNALKSDLKSLENKMESLDQSVGRLRSFGHKLRIISSLDLAGTAPIFKNDSEKKKSKKKDSTETSFYNSKPEHLGTDADPIESEGQSAGALSGSDEKKHAQLEEQRTKVLLSAHKKNLRRGKAIESYLGEFSHSISRLHRDVNEEEKNFAKLQEKLQDQVTRLRHLPSIFPAKGWISSEFGYRYNPFSQRRTLHAGLDIANNKGTPIYAPADGKVTLSGNYGSFGKLVRIDHGFGVITKYGHLSRILVKHGDRIKRGELIAKMGNSGRSTGSHLHYQVEYKGKPVNPRLFILDDI